LGVYLAVFAHENPHQLLCLLCLLESIPIGLVSNNEQCKTDLSIVTNDDIYCDIIYNFISFSALTLLVGWVTGSISISQ